MGIVFFCIGTMVISVYMEISNKFRFYKDVADAGYKIGSNNNTKYKSETSSNSSKSHFYHMFIPIYNIIQVYKHTIDYNNIRPYIVNQLINAGLLEKMTVMEKEEYEKRPTGLNAILVPLKINVKKIYASRMTIENGNLKGDIYYKKGKAFDDITIISSTGTISKLPIEEQKKEVLRVLFDVAIKGVEKYGVTGFENEIKKSGSMVVKSYSEENTNTIDSNEALSRVEIIEALKKLRDDMCGSETSQEKEKGTQYTKRK